MRNFLRYLLALYGCEIHRVHGRARKMLIRKLGGK